MENSSKVSGGVVIPKKKRSLDLKSLYESRLSEVGGSKGKSTGEDEKEDVKKKKKRKGRKEVSLSSLEPDAKKRKKDDENGETSDQSFRDKLDSWSRELHGISFAMGDSGRPFIIPKRPRGSVGGKKMESDQGSEPLRKSNSVDCVGAFKADVIKSADKGGPTDKLVKSVTFSAGKDGVSNSRLAGKVVGSDTKSSRKVDTKSSRKVDTKSSRKVDTKSTMKSSSSNAKLTKKAGNDETVDGVGAFEGEVTLSEGKVGPDDQSVMPVTLSSGNDGVSNSRLKGNAKSKRKADSNSTMNSGSSKVKLKKVGGDEAGDRVGAFKAEVTKSVDKGGLDDRLVGSLTFSVGKDGVSNSKLAGKVVASTTKSKQKGGSKYTVNSSNLNVKVKKKVGGDEAVDRVGTFKAKVTKSEGKGGPNDQVVSPVTLSLGNDGVSNSRLAGKVVGSNTKSNRKTDSKSTVNSSRSDAKLKKKVGADEDEDKGSPKDQLVGSPVTLSAVKDGVSNARLAGKVVGSNIKSKRKTDSKSIMNSSSSDVKLKKKGGADEDEEKGGPENQLVGLVTFSAGKDGLSVSRTAGKAVGSNTKSKRKADPKSTMNSGSSDVKLKMKVRADEDEDKGGLKNKLVESVTLSAGNDDISISRLAGKAGGPNTNSKRKADSKSTMNSGILDVQLKKKAGADEDEDKGGSEDQLVGSVTFSAVNKDDVSVSGSAGKFVGSNTKSKRKADSKSTMNSGNSALTLKKKVGVDENVDKGGLKDQVVGSVTLFAGNDDVSISRLAGKAGGSKTKLKRKADPKSTMNSSSSDVKSKKKVVAVEDEDKGGLRDQLVGSVTVAAGNDSASISRLGGKVVGSNKKSKRKEVSKSTMNPSNSNVKSKKVGAHESVDRAGAFKAKVKKSEVKGVPSDPLVRSVAFSIDNDGVPNSSLAGKDVGSKTKSKPKADTKSTMNASSPNGKLEQKVGGDDVKGKKDTRSDSVQHVAKESNLIENNGDTSAKKRGSNSRKKKDLVVGRGRVEASKKKSELALGSSVSNNPITDILDDDDDDEENLEQNAARMLSSRFDPSCTGFSSKRKSSVSQMDDKFSVPVSSAQDSISQRAKSLDGGESATGDDNSRALRPREGDKDSGMSKKRRHFYDIPGRDLDPNWVLNRRIKIYWPLDESWYYGHVIGYHSEALIHHLKYDDGEEEWVNLEEEKFKLLLLRSEVPGKGPSRKRSTGVRDLHIEETVPPADNDRGMGDDLDSEPIAAWLASQSQHVKALPKSSKRQKKSHNQLHLVSSLSYEKIGNSNGDADSSELNVSKPGCESASADQTLVCGTVDKFWLSQGGKNLVYFRKYGKKRGGSNSVRRGAKARGNDPWPVKESLPTAEGNKSPCDCVDPGKQLLYLDDKGLVTLNDVWLELNEFTFQICLPLFPCMKFSCGIRFSWLLHDIFMHQHGVIMTTSPAVILKMLFIDNDLGLRVLSFEGCLMQALAIFSMIVSVFSQSDEHWKGDKKLPETSIRFQLSSVQDLRKQHVFAFYRFSKLQSSKWLDVDSKILKRCRFIKQLSVSECTYGNLEELETGLFQPCKPRVGLELSSCEATRKNFELGIMPMGVSREGCNTRMSQSTFSLTAEPGNVPQFALSFSASSDFLFRLHLESLLEHGFARDDQHYDPLCSPESSGNGGQPVAECAQFSVAVLDINNMKTNSADKLEKGLSSHQKVDMPCAGKGRISRSSLKRGRSTTISSLLERKSPVWADSPPVFMPEGFVNGPKKPRTHVQYTLPFVGCETPSPRSIPCKRIRRASLKRICDGSGDNQKNLALLTCFANVLVTHGDKGWRECGANIVSELSDHKEWKLAVQLSGVTKFSYKVTHILQPGSTNRYSHAVIWKGGKDWVLEFPDRSQWMLFKEMYEECYNRNIRAASVKNIPIPGVRLVEESDDYGDEVPFVRNSKNYFQQVQTDAQMAMDPSHILYDMDSDDEEWLMAHKNCTDKLKYEETSEEYFEMTMDMFEKVSYAQRRDNFSDAEIEELAIGIGSVEAAKLIYQHWRQKREKMSMPLIRHFQPPPWVRYQKLLKEWDHNVALSCQEKVPPPEKPPMFAFCFKPRGLDVPNRASKQRSHRKLSVSGLHRASSGDHSHLVSGRRSNGHAFGDEKVVYTSNVNDSSDVSPSLYPSTRALSSREAHFTLSASVSEWKVNNRKKVHKNKKRKKLGSFQRATGADENGVQHWNGGPPELSGQSRPYPDWPHRNISDLPEFYLREAIGASRHAHDLANLMRERAQNLHCKADLVIHKAASALMKAEAIKGSYGNSNGVN